MKMAESYPRSFATAAMLVEGLAKLVVFLSVTFVVGEIVLSDTPLYHHVLYEYLLYIQRLMRLDLGVNADGVRIVFYLQPALWNTLRLFIAPMVLSLVAAYLLGTSMYVHGARPLRNAIQAGATVTSAVPIYWLALIFFVFAIETGWFPIGGVSGSGADRMSLVPRTLNYLHHLVLPWISLMLYPVVMISARLEARLSELADRGFVRALVSRGYSRRRIVHEHLRPVVWSDVLQTFASLIPMLVTFLVLVERVFNYPGLGMMTIGQYRAIGPTPDTSMSQAALTYLGVLAIAMQTLARMGTSFLLPPSGRDELRYRAPAPMPVLLAAGALAGMAFAPLSAGGQWTDSVSGGSSFVIVRVVFAVAGVAIVAAASLANRRTRAGTPVRMSAGRDAPAPLVIRNPVHIGRGIARLVTKGRASLQRALSGLRAPGGRSTVGVLLAAGAVSAVIVLSFNVEPPPSAYANPIMASRMRGEWWVPQYALRALTASRFLLIPLSVAVAASAIGIAAGTVSGLSTSRPADKTVDLLEMAPSVVVLVMLSAVTGQSLWALAITLGLVGSIRMYRVMRYEVSRIRAADYIAYSNLLGTGTLGLLFRHLRVNLSRVIAQTSILIAVDLVVLEANLSFLGSLYQIPFEYRQLLPVAGWGSMLNETRSLLVRGETAPALIPAAFLVLFVVALRYIAARISRGGSGR